MNNMVFFKDTKSCPVLDWLNELDKRTLAKAYVRLQRLKELGHLLRRPEADYLRDGIYELRWKNGHVNFRVLYGFNGKELIILLHGLTKEKEVPEKDIEQALSRLNKFKQNPKAHTYEEEL